MALRAEQIGMTLASALELARKAAGLSQDDLWFRYKQAGGKIGLAAFKMYLRGQSDPQWHEYAIIADVLNEAIGEERLPRLPFLRSSGGAGDVTSVPQDSAKGGQHSHLTLLRDDNQAA